VGLGRPNGSSYLKVIGGVKMNGLNAGFEVLLDGGANKDLVDLQ